MSGLDLPHLSVQAEGPLLHQYVIVATKCQILPQHLWLILETCVHLMALRVLRVTASESTQ